MTIERQHKCNRVGGWAGIWPRAEHAWRAFRRQRAPQQGQPPGTRVCRQQLACSALAKPRTQRPGGLQSGAAAAPNKGPAAAAAPKGSACPKAAYTWQSGGGLASTTPGSGGLSSALATGLALPQCGRRCHSERSCVFSSTAESDCGVRGAESLATGCPLPQADWEGRSYIFFPWGPASRLRWWSAQQQPLTPCCC